MKYRAVCHIVSLLLLVLGLCMLLAVLVSYLSLSEGDTLRDVTQLLMSAIATLSCGGLMFVFSRRRPGEAEFSTGAREGYAAVAFAWIVASFFCALPFVAVAGFKPVDAYFEAASGLTTTGASIIDDKMSLLWNSAAVKNRLEHLPKGLLFWRSMMNWIGGVGIVFFLLLILPLMHVTQGKQLYNAEVPGMKTKGDQLTPRLATSVKWILGVYCFLTLLAAVLYTYFGMSPLDAICHAFSTISTGGFSTKCASIGHYKEPSIHWCVTVFMFISACNFSLIIKLFLGRTFASRFSFLKDEEFRFFALMVFFALIIITIGLKHQLPKGNLYFSDGTPIKTLGDCIRTAAFQVATVCSTTGFGTSDYLSWQIPLALMLIGVMMLPCGCGGSTAGGMKCSRVIVLLKQLRYEIKHCIMPRTLPDVRLNGERLDNDIVAKTFSFVLLYLSIFVFVAIAVSVFEAFNPIPEPKCDLATAIGASLTSISNVGPGFGKVGPSANFAWLTWESKLLLSFTMITGRLELYTVLVILFPSFWRR